MAEERVFGTTPVSRVIRLVLSPGCYLRLSSVPYAGQADSSVWHKPAALASTSVPVGFAAANFNSVDPVGVSKLDKHVVSAYRIWGGGGMGALV